MGGCRLASIELLGPGLNVEKTFQGSRKETCSIDFNDNQLIGTGGYDQIVRIYNISGSAEPVKVSLFFLGSFLSEQHKQKHLTSDFGLKGVW